MGFFKKIFKPVSKVLDKIIPNEIKPALPFAAAFAPYLLPSGIMGTGMAQRALMGGGLNIFGQLSQEGNEGDINLLSAGLGALTGAMTAPGGGPTIGEGVKGAAATGSDAGFFVSEGVPLKGTTGFQDFAAKGIERFGAESAGGQVLTGLSKASKFMTDPGLTKFTAPVAQATGDLMFAQAKRDQDEYDRMMEEESEADAASDAQRAFAIRRAMEAYGATEEEIQDAIYAAGYKTGGRVGLRFGGIGDAVENIEDAEMKEAAKFAMQDMDIPIMDLVEEFEIQFKRKPNSMEELKQFYKDRYEYKGPGDVKMKEEIKEKVVMEAKDGGRIGFKDGSDGSSTGNFGADRYASELIEAYGSILNKGDMFLTDVEKELIERGEYPSPDKMKDFQTRYENLEKEYEKEEDKFGNIDLQDSLLDEDAIKYYNKKVKDLEDKEDRLMNKEEKLNEVMYTDLDVSGILKTPEFQEWYRLWKAKDPKADDLPNAEYFENMMFDTKRLRPDFMKTKYDVEMKDGGLMNLGGKEMDLRKGGFVPIGKKERADDVPARLSKNEFVMTADAVRAAGGGSVNEGAKRMYKVMNDLEARA